MISKTEDMESVEQENKIEEILDLNGLWQRESKRLARNPCLYFWTSLVVSIILSVIAMIVGEFSVSANTGGWTSRGTLIADRHTQVMMTLYFQEYLFFGGDAAWADLTHNVQTGWETEATNGNARRLDSKWPPKRKFAGRGQSNTIIPKIASPSLITKHVLGEEEPLESLPETTGSHYTFGMPFHFTGDMKRRLFENYDSLEGCDTDWYTSPNVTIDTHLWPIWVARQNGDTILSPNLLHDLCIAESNTQQFLVRNELCFGCSNGACLPPYSIVLHARLTIPGGMNLTCDELQDAWVPYQTSIEAEWKQCVVDAKATYTPNHPYELPPACPFGFSTVMVDADFDTTNLVVYTSSIFATIPGSVQKMYDNVEQLDRGSDLVHGAYDTQYEDFVQIEIENSISRDMALAMGSALIVAIAVLIHTRSPFITLIGLTQIVLSFPLSYFFYNIVARLQFFPFLNFIGIFVVFALGAGDIFVAVDKWKNARLEHPRASTENIAALALPDAAGAMFMTTITTAIAFFATAICPVAPIKMFAIFCGLLIMFDYVMNILLVFPAICIYDGRITNKVKQGRDPNCCIRCDCYPLLKETHEHGDDYEHGAIDTEGFVAKDDHADGHAISDDPPSLIRRILLGYYHLLHKCRWPLLVICLGAIGACSYVASTLKLPTSSDVRVLDSSIQYEESNSWRQKLLYDVLLKSGGSRAYVIWGVRPADTGDHSKLKRLRGLLILINFHIDCICAFVLS